MKHENITGIVLAGGKSSRIGTNKALLEYLGKPLINHAVDTLSTVCHRVMISAGTNTYVLPGIDEWPDEFAVNAPIAGIFTCLKHSADKWNLVLSCDMPLIEGSFLKNLVAERKNYDVVLPVHADGTTEPLCALYNRNILDAMEERIICGKFGISEFALTVNHKLIATGTKRYMFLNINTTQDFDLLNKS